MEFRAMGCKHCNWESPLYPAGKVPEDVKQAYLYHFKDEHPEEYVFEAAILDESLYRDEHHGWN